MSDNSHRTRHVQEQKYKDPDCFSALEDSEIREELDYMLHQWDDGKLRQFVWRRIMKRAFLHEAVRRGIDVSDWL